MITRKGPDQYLQHTPNGTKTGANYKGLLLYDLAVFMLTNLPSLAHDSLLFKNMAEIMRIYFIDGDFIDDRKPVVKRERTIVG